MVGRCVIDGWRDRCGVGTDGVLPSVIRTTPARFDEGKKDVVQGFRANGTSADWF